ncbi:uncharacterized protein VK521_014378 [Ammospiza maritima maritima]
MEHGTISQLPGSWVSPPAQLLAGLEEGKATWPIYGACFAYFLVTSHSRPQGGASQLLRDSAPRRLSFSALPLKFLLIQVSNHVLPPGQGTVRLLQQRILMLWRIPLPKE